MIRITRTALLLCFASCCAAATTSAQDTGGSEAPARTVKYSPMGLQVALERAGFSPGLLDGRPGAKTTMAIEDFQRSMGLEVTGKINAETAEALKLADTEATTTYTITQADADHVTGPSPKSWNDKAEMAELGYFDLADAVSEKFHTKPDTLVALNPGLVASQLAVGQELTVPAADAQAFPAVARIEINLSQKAIRGFDRSDKQVLLVYCSIAKDKAKRPAGEGHVKVVAMNPNYTFDPAIWPDVHDVTHKLTIPPGPRNPVGIAWIGIDLPGYGMHGTPRPADIGKTGSHGCFRLANWDAIRLAKAVRVGIPITFIGEGE